MWWQGLLELREIIWSWGHRRQAGSSSSFPQLLLNPPYIFFILGNDQGATKTTGPKLLTLPELEQALPLTNPFVGTTKALCPLSNPYISSFSHSCMLPFLLLLHTRKSRNISHCVILTSIVHIKNFGEHHLVLLCMCPPPRGISPWPFLL